MSFYDDYILPHILDLMCGMKAVREQREMIVPRASGRVLEIGIGTGRNLEFYDPERITEVVGVDPEQQMHPKARKRLSKTGIKAEILPLSAEEIPLEDESVDTVLTTFTLCTIPDPEKALREMRRVLKSEGSLLFCEHGLSPVASEQKWQHRLNKGWGKIAGGCNLNRHIVELVSSAGFRISDLEQDYMTRPNWLSYVSWGMARRQ